MHIRSYYFLPIRLMAILLLVGLMVVRGKAQNLVLNNSFEVNINCGSVANGGVNGWNSPLQGYIKLNTYSYFNLCSKDSCCGVPSNNYRYGWQYARTGLAYVGFWFTNNNGGSDRIYLQTKLNDSLKANHCYLIEFYVNLYNYAKYANNNISLLVGDTGIVSYNGQPAYAFPQIQQYGNPCITDTLNWVKVGGIYTAHGGEQYITIGNFTDDAHTDTLKIQSTFGSSGYNIDDVSVIPLDSMQLKAEAGRDTTIVKGDSVWIGSRLCGLTNVVWYDGANNIIDTGAPGLWVKPTSNTFYIIEQDVCGQYSRDTVFVNVQPLPVTIKNYELKIKNRIQGDGVENVWETASEINVSHFNVQRSEDGVTFETIGTVKAKGAGKYSLTPNPSPSERGVTCYFRLEVVDKNGALSYSEVKELSIENGGLMISPNPAKDFISISGGNIKEVRISDVSGRILMVGRAKKVDVRGLVSGVYYVAIESLNGNHVVHKFIKLP